MSPHDELYRILTDDGVMFLNLGDTYYSGKVKSHGTDPKSKKRRFGLRAVDRSGGLDLNLKPKSVIGIPWRVAFELANRKWVLRSSIIWHRKHALREAVIVDKTQNGIKGLQGIHIYGWDGFNAINTRVEFIAGSGVVLGGNVNQTTVGGDALGDVRESFFYDTKVRYSGDVNTGQPAMSLISTMQRGLPGADEINEIGFIGGQLVTEYGESLTIGTYDPAHTGFAGPGNIFFTRNFQIEGSNYLATGNPGQPSSVPAIATQFDVIHIIQGSQIFFNQGEIAVSGYGRAAVRIDTANSVSFDQVELYADGNSRTYTVSLTNGSTVATWKASDDGNGFLVSHSLDGIAVATVISNSNPNCGSPCVFHLSSTNGVPNSTTLNLASPYTGTTTSSQLIHMPTGGYLVNVVGSVQGLYVNGGYIVPPLTPSELTALGAQSPRQVLYVGSPQPPGVQQTLQWYTSAPLTNVVYDAPSVPQGTVYAPELTTGHGTQRFFGNGPWRTVLALKDSTI